MGAGDNFGALAAADELLKIAPGSFIGRFGRARALIRMGNEAEGARELEQALALSPKDENARLVKAKLDFRTGRTEEGLVELRALSRGRGAIAADAGLNLLHALHYAGRHEELEEAVAAGGAWTSEPAAGLHRARATARKDRERGAEELRAFFASNAPIGDRCYAAFDAVDHLDKLGRYREAFDLAKAAHALTPVPIDLGRGRS